MARVSNSGVALIQRQQTLAEDKPIIGSINGSCANFINNNEIGYACASSDAQALANIIINLDIKELDKIGKHAREVYLNKYSKDKFINTLITQLNKYSK